MGTATFIKQKNGTGEGKVYRLDPPIEIKDYDVELGGYKVIGTSEHVWVSATVAMFSGPETYIFPSDENGEVTDWGELEGSYRGGLDHEEALRGAGYTVV
jgi:hypothetical protein